MKTKRNKHRLDNPLKPKLRKVGGHTPRTALRTPPTLLPGQIYWVCSKDANSWSEEEAVMHMYKPIDLDMGILGKQAGMVSFAKTHSGQLVLFLEALPNGYNRVIVDGIVAILDSRVEFFEVL